MLSLATANNPGEVEYRFCSSDICTNIDASIEPMWSLDHKLRSIVPCICVPYHVTQGHKRSVLNSNTAMGHLSELICDAIYWANNKPSDLYLSTVLILQLDLEEPVLISRARAGLITVVQSYHKSLLF